jgi:hypothetical protein
MAAACLVVRAVVPVADRASFDDWYHIEHLPDAVKAFAACSAWRGWSRSEPSVHCAYYRFESLERLDAILNGPEIAALIAEFDRCWHGRVTRTRDVLVIADEIGNLAPDDVVKETGP